MGASVNNMRMESGTQLQARGVAHNQLENNHGSVRGRTLTKHSDDDDSSDEDLHSRIGLDVEDLACHVRAAYERGCAAGGSRDDASSIAALPTRPAWTKSDEILAPGIGDSPQQHHSDTYILALARAREAWLKVEHSTDCEWLCAEATDSEWFWWYGAQLAQVTVDILAAYAPMQDQYAVGEVECLRDEVKACSVRACEVTRRKQAGTYFSESYSGATRDEDNAGTTSRVHMLPEDHQVEERGHHSETPQPRKGGEGKCDEMWGIASKKAQAEMANEFPEGKHHSEHWIAELYARELATKTKRIYERMKARTSKHHRKDHRVEERGQGSS